MKSALKSISQFIVSSLMFLMVFIIPGMVLPVPDKLASVMTPNLEEMKLFFPLLLLFSCYMAYSYGLLLKNSNHTKIVFFIKLLLANLLIFPLMGLLESLFWINAFKNFKDINPLDLLPLFYPFIVTYLLYTTYLTYVYKPKNLIKNINTTFNYSGIGIKIIGIAILYFIIYNLAGYFIAWQFEATRLFYTDSTEIKSFIPAMTQNLSDSKFVVVHLLRGVLFAIAGYLIYSLLTGTATKKNIIMSLIFGGFGFQIIVPNPLFPEAVRISHFLETTISMWIFGFLMAVIYSLNRAENSSKQVAN